MLGKRVIADIINLKILRSSWITQVGLKSNDKCPSKGQEDREDHVKMKAEVGVMQLPEATRS